MSSKNQSVSVLLSTCWLHPRIGFLHSSKKVAGAVGCSTQIPGRKRLFMGLLKEPDSPEPLANLFSCEQEVSHSGREISLPLDKRTHP